MTEGHERDYLVTVRAQVMTRDESTEGWIPLAGGGLANVSIRKRAKLSPGANAYEYIIYGQRVSDQNVILSCAINRDLKYYKVMPTFHHWRSGKQRNGLTFQTAADARAFDKGILRAYNELAEGLSKLNPANCPPLNKYDSVGEDDVFMTLELPFETESIHKFYSSPEGSEKSHVSFSERGFKDTTSNNSETERSDRPTIHYISSDKSSIQPISSVAATIEPPPTIAPSENYSYVTLTAMHDYNYPVADQPAAAQVLNARRESINALKKRHAMEAATQALATQSSPISLVTRKDGSVDGSKKAQRVRCRYCHELYTEDSNRRGACEFAPDCFRSGFECMSGMGCARCMLYHCMSDSEGETPQHPCECVNESGCTKRWIGLTLLSFIVPCLWCYPPLRACHWVGVSCGVCGGKHKPQD